MVKLLIYFKLFNDYYYDIDKKNDFDYNSTLYYFFKEYSNYIKIVYLENFTKQTLSN
jgi:hypothetical protein